MSIGATAAMATAAQAEDINVTTMADAGAGSLRAAIVTANETPGTSDRILFQSGLSGTITLESDLPLLPGPTEITGPGKDQLTVDGDGQFQVFLSRADISVSGLTISGGAGSRGGGIGVSDADLTAEGIRVTNSAATQEGGGIGVRNGRLILTDSEITGNEAPVGGGLAAYNSSVEIDGTTFSGNEAVSGSTSQGGAAVLLLPAGAKSTISDSSFSGNHAQQGGGIFTSLGDLAIDSTLISGNTADTAFGGLILGFPGPTPVSSSNFSITNSTIAGNEADWGFAGVGSATDDLTIDSSTITGNVVTAPGSAPPGFPIPDAAGIVQGNGGMKLVNSIVSGNLPHDIGTTTAQPGPAASPAGEINGAFNLIGNQSSGTDFNETVANSNITGTDPQLGALADNGGPTMTMLPADSSPVINKGSSSLTTDARDLLRPLTFPGVPFSTAAGANGADIGAVELQKTAPPAEPSNAFSFGWIKLNKKKGVASLQIMVPGAGRVLVLGSKTVAKSSKAAKGASTIAVTIKAKGRAAKQLKKKGKAKVKASVRFTPTGGTAKTKSKTVKLVRKKPKKR